MSSYVISKSRPPSRSSRSSRSSSKPKPRFSNQLYISRGAFGKVVSICDSKFNDRFALKLEDKDCEVPQLQIETKILRHFAQLKIYGVAEYFWHGTIILKNKVYNAMEMRLYGPSLKKLFEQQRQGKFTLKTVVTIAIKGLRILERIHRAHVIHRDLKPDNFVVGLQVEESSQIFLIDFGLSKRYRDDESDHIEDGASSHMIGTPRYASRNNHMYRKLSRRDDLESFFYILVYFIRGQLPWQEYETMNFNDEHERNVKIGELKNHKFKYDSRQFCANLPDCFILMYHYVCELDFNQEPDYKYLRNLFRKTFIEREFLDDERCDWNGY